MKKKNFLIITALFIAVLTAFYGCRTPSDQDITKASLSDVNNTETEISQPETTQKIDVTKEKVIALTFDDGPRSSTTNQILDILSENDATATFFVVGYNIEGNTETINRALDMGCEIGNHSMDHKTFTKCSSAEIGVQLNGVNDLLERNCDYRPTLCRTPGGSYKGVTQYIDMPIILWSIDTEDWKHKDKTSSTRTEEQRNEELNNIANAVFSDVREGDIILMHDIYDFTVDLCRILIPGLVERGYKIVTVSKMFDLHNCKLSNGEVYRNCRFAGDPASVTVGDYFVSTDNSNLNLRSDSNISGDILCQVPNGTRLKVEAVFDGWAKVEYDGFSGWVSAKYLRPVE